MAAASRTMLGLSKSATSPKPKKSGDLGMRAICDRAVALLFALSLLVVSATVVRAGPYEVALAHFPRVTQPPQEGVLGRAQADTAQFLVVQSAYRPVRLAQGVAETGGGGRFGSLAAHIRCICM